MWSGAGPGPEGGGGNGGIGGVDKPVAGGTVVAGSRMLQRTRWPGPAAAETPAATPDQPNSRHVSLRSCNSRARTCEKKARICEEDR